MNVDKFIDLLEAFYTPDKYPLMVKIKIKERYKDWSEDGLKALYEVVTDNISRSYKCCPDIAQMKPLENEALDQRDLVRLARKPIPGQKLLRGPSEDEQWEQVETWLSDLTAKLTRRKATRPD